MRYCLAPQFSVQANLNNLLDKQYFSQINGYGAYGDGRNGSITFTWSFQAAPDRWSGAHPTGGAGRWPAPRDG